MPRPTPRLLATATALALALALAGPCTAALDAQCSWPPPGGPAVLPESTDVMMTPVVADLDADGTPEIVVITFVDVLDPNAGVDGVLRILRGDDCSEVATTVDVGCVTCVSEPACESLDERADPGFLCPGCGVAVADLDRDGLLEIVAVAEGFDGELEDGAGHRRLVVFDHEGNFVRCTERVPSSLGLLAYPSIADLDADGSPELLARQGAWRTDGTLLFDAPPAGIGPVAVQDLDLDGSPEVVLGDSAHRADGTLLWDRPDLGLSVPAIGDFTNDCVPEVVVTAPRRAELHVLDGATGATIAQALLPGGLDACPDPRPDQGGPPTLADVDGDCVPEIGVAGCEFYTFYRFEPGPPASLVEIWRQPISDRSSRITGSTIFDLEADGTFEVLYNDEFHLRVYDALTGVVLDERPNTTATLLEYPTLADADGDGLAEIVVGSNDYFFAGVPGVTVISDPTVSWAPTRPLMNQHAYHVTNVEDDGTIPPVEDANWARLNNYRVQVTPTGCRRDDCTGPPECDAGPPITAECTGECASGGVRVTLEAAAPAPEPGLTFEWDVSACCPPGEPCTDETLFGPSVTTCLPLACGECPVTLTVTDATGESSSCVTTVTAVDALPPALSGVPADETVACAAGPSPVVTASDACAGDLDVGFTEQVVEGDCPHRRTILRTWSAADDCGNETSATQRIEVRDDAPPQLVGVPDDTFASCEAPPPPPVSATDECSGPVPVDFTEDRVDGPCPGTFVLLRTWSAEDDCENEASATRTVTVSDDEAPVLTGVPADLRVPCEAPPPAPVTATDDCEGVVPVALSEERVDGPCPDAFVLLRTWSAVDACGNEVTATQRVEVFDDTPPTIEPPPPDTTVDCRAVPAPYGPVVGDDCDGAPSVVFTEERVDQGCPYAYDLVRTWVARDRCGNESSVERTVSVRDTVPPDLFVPEPLVLECTGPGGVAADDPRVLAWLARASAVDDCSGVVPVAHDTPPTLPVGCAGDPATTITFSAVDECGNGTSATSTIQVIDTQPPEITAVELPGCLWSPNHRYWCVTDLADRVTVRDACDEDVVVFVEGCASDQPDEAPLEDDRGGRREGNGDGHHADDCVVAPDGSGLCLRPERQGTDPEGRTYPFTIVAVDSCGNRAEWPASIHVPHDQRDHPCRNVPNAELLLPHEPFPWE